MIDYYKVFQPLIYKLPSELAHNLAIYALKHHLVKPTPLVYDDILQQKIWGMEFLSPIGLAAGFDKNADAVESLFRQGFGFVEIGTITPRPQVGNPKPRLFRLDQDKAIINRMGFNSEGANKIAKKLDRKLYNGILGINIGPNKDSKNSIDDYLILFEKFYDLANYITINVSSPNTPGLRDMQKQRNLQKLLSNLSNKRTALAKLRNKFLPIFLKISPDVNSTDLINIIQAAEEFKIDGLIISNTTVHDREKLLDRHSHELGGLSGKPLFHRANRILAEAFVASKGLIPIIGAGGIFSAEDAYLKIQLGASLLQIYTVIIYHGFSILAELNHGLAELLKKDGYSHINEARGTKAIEFLS